MVGNFKIWHADQVEKAGGSMQKLQPMLQGIGLYKIQVTAGSGYGNDISQNGHGLRQNRHW